MKIIHVVSLAAALALPWWLFEPEWAYAQQDQPQQNDDDYIREAVRLDRRYDNVVEGGCKYSLEITGTITPLPGQENEQPPQVTPNVAVTAQAACPAEESLKITNNVLGTGPLTWRQLANSLAERARVVTTEKNHECTFAPSLRVVGSRVDVTGFDHHCRAI
jgi:hypothetical protein